MVKKKQLGVGAVCIVLTKYLHPAKVINEKYPNATSSSRTGGLICMKKEKRIVNKREQEVAVFRHDDFAVEIYSVLRWVKVEHEGDSEDIFEEDESNENPNVAEEEELPEEGDIIPQSVFDSSGVSEDIAMVIGQGFQVDDDNEPAEENVPTPTVDDSTNSNYVEAEWNWNGMCPRKMNGCRNMKPCLKGVEKTMLEKISLLTMFLLMIPKNILKK